MSIFPEGQTAGLFPLPRSSSNFYFLLARHETDGPLPVSPAQASGRGEVTGQER